MTQVNTTKQGNVLPRVGTAIVAQIPDNTATGGNARGVNAVDLQTIRFFESSVASGERSVTSGGSDNRASGFGSTVSGGSSSVAAGDYSTVSGGAGHEASGLASTVSGGFGNLALGERSTVSGGSSNSSSGEHSTVSGGFINTATGKNSTISGGAFATTNGIGGLWAYGFDGESQGRNQMSFFGARATTTTNAPTRATSDGFSASTTNQLTLRNNSAFLISGYVSARDTATNDSKYWTFQGAIKRGAAAANAALVGTPTINTVAQDTAASTWAIALSADTANGSLAVTVTGEAAKTIRWTVVIHSIEVA